MSKLDDILTNRLNEVDRVLTKLGHMNQTEIVRHQKDEAKNEVAALFLNLVTEFTVLYEDEDGTARETFDIDGFKRAVVEL